MVSISVLGFEKFARKNVTIWAPLKARAPKTKNDTIAQLVENFFRLLKMFTHENVRPDVLARTKIILGNITFPLR